MRLSDIYREEDRRAQHAMFRRLNRCRLCAFAPILFAGAGIVALSFAGTVAIVQAAALL